MLLQLIVDAGEIVLHIGNCLQVKLAVGIAELCLVDSFCYTCETGKRVVRKVVHHFGHTAHGGDVVADVRYYGCDRPQWVMRDLFGFRSMLLRLGYGGFQRTRVF